MFPGASKSAICRADVFTTKHDTAYETSLRFEIEFSWLLYPGISQKTD